MGINSTGNIGNISCGCRAFGPLASRLWTFGLLASRLWTFGLLASGAFLAACSQAPEMADPSLQDMPGQWSQPVSGSPLPPAGGTAGSSALRITGDGPPWWSLLGSPQLDQLEQQAIGNSLTLKAAVARVRQAQANLRSAGAPLLPSLSADAGETLSHRHGSPSAGSGSAGSSRSVSASVSASYEVDFWGSRANTIAAAGLEAGASEADRQTALLTLTADVATTYIEILSLQEQLRVTRRNMELSRQTLELTQKLADFGQGSMLEVVQQRSALAAVEAGIPALELSLAQARHSLAILSGLPPLALDGEMAALPEEALSRLRVPVVDSGVPADLLFNRPDLRAAEARLRAANANIGVARAALLPGATLSAGRSYSATAISSLASPAAAAWSLAGSLAATLFDNGARQAAVDSAWAKKEELAATWAQAVLEGLRDTGDALSAAALLAEQEQRQEVVVQSAREGWSMASTRWREGATDYLTVLDAQRTLLAAEKAAVEVRQQRLVAFVSLGKALGGTTGGKPGE